MSAKKEHVLATGRPDEIARLTGLMLQLQHLLSQPQENAAWHTSVHMQVIELHQCSARAIGAI